MVTFIWLLFLAGLTLASISLQKVYHRVPAKELRRRARTQEPMAELLYRAVSYGANLRILLWAFIGTSAALFFSELSDELPTGLAVLIGAGVIWFGFAWVPNTRVSKLAAKLAQHVTPALIWLLDVLHPVLQRVGMFLDRFRPVSVHTGLYQKEDIVELMKQQKAQEDNRATKEELNIAINALTFGDKLVRDCMVPRREVKSVNITDSVGPVLMGELYDSGYSRFPVYSNKQDNLVGMLYLRDLVDVKSGGQVKTFMRKELCYVHDEETMLEALQAFLKTKHQLFIVVNSFEEFIGILTIEDVLEQIIGKPIIDEFDQYDDLRAVAQKKANKEHRRHESKEAAGE